MMFPPFEIELTRHPLGSFAVARVNDHGTRLRRLSEELYDLHAITGVCCVVRIWVQIVVQRNERGFGQIRFDFGDHFPRLPPDVNWHAGKQRFQNSKEPRDSIRVVFQNKNQNGHPQLRRAIRN